MPIHITLICLNIGTAKTSNFPFGTNGKLIVLGVLILKPHGVAYNKPPHVDLIFEQTFLIRLFGLKGLIDLTHTNIQVFKLFLFSWHVQVKNLLLLFS